jgi:hypothetical protein
MTGRTRFSMGDITYDDLREIIRDELRDGQHAVDHAWVAEQRRNDQRWDVILQWAEIQIRQDNERAEMYRELRKELAKAGLIGFTMGILVLLAIGAHEWFNDWLHKPAIKQ